jgi:hypothetical protein
VTAENDISGQQLTVDNSDDASISANVPDSPPTVDATENPTISEEALKAIESLETALKEEITTTSASEPDSPPTRDWAAIISAINSPVLAPAPAAASEDEASEDESGLLWRGTVARSIRPVGDEHVGPSRSAGWRRRPSNTYHISGDHMSIGQTAGQYNLAHMYAVLAVHEDGFNPFEVLVYFSSSDPHFYTLLPPPQNVGNRY